MEKDKKEDIKQSNNTDASLGGYGQQTTYGVDFSRLDLSTAQRKQEYEDHQKQKWKDSVAGRGFIRMFSRGVLGAGAFAWGTYYAGNKMRLYNPRLPAKNWVQGIAKAYDFAFGVPIRSAVNALGYDGEKFLTFRPTLDWSGYNGAKGRSLGHEVVGVTFDFAAMSIGDFWGRKIADTLDPNVKKEWVNENGSIDYNKALGHFGYNWWTALTYAAGEDWAVGVPYVLTMRHIGTPLINKAFPGYAADFDRNGNGGSMLVNDQGRVRSNFTAAGVFNLWERFTTYNIGTLMFREAYTWAGNRIRHIWQHGERAPLLAPDPDNPDRTTGETAIDAMKSLGMWGSRNVVKATMYMIPAVPFFWLSRVPQHKYRGFFIHPEKGILKYMSEGEEHALRAHAFTADPAFTAQTPVFFSKTREPAINPFLHSEDIHKTYGWVDWLLKPIGELCDEVRYRLWPIGRWIDKHPDAARHFGLELDVSPLGIRKLRSGRALTSTYANAALAYTPYFWAKSDLFAHEWDTGRMDVSVDRALKGVYTLNTSEIGKGINEIGYSLRGKPLPDPKREEEAQYRIEHKLTPTDSSFDVNPIAERVERQHGTVNTEGFADRLRLHKRQAQSRMDQFRQQAQPASFAQGVEDAALRAPTYAEQERIRKEGASLEPPGPDVTIH